MKVSCIIPSYRQAAYLRACLDSIAAQNLATGEFEVRVYDGGSDDGTTEILAGHPLHPWWVSERDAGQGAAVNRGLRESRGEIIAWINSDDYYLPEALPAVLEAFAANPTVEVIYGNARNVDEAGRDRGPHPVEPWSYAALADRCFLCQPAVFFRRSVVEKAGCLDESLKLALDYEYWLRLGKTRAFLHLPRDLAANRVHAASKTSRLPVQGRREALLVSHRHTGRWSAAWLGSLASRTSENFWAQLGLHSSALTWLGKQLLLPVYRLRLRRSGHP
ncbi:MAG TPA: glycosyltransferase family 2 protein [Opitutales bacterium]|nr:glycosyltransferase family 2 protein [Opitutales bacterium]